MGLRDEITAMRNNGATCFEIYDKGGCVFCWGKGDWMAISDAEWHRAGRSGQTTNMRCGACFGTGMNAIHRPPRASRKSGADQ